MEQSPNRKKDFLRWWITNKEQERAEQHRAVWSIANDTPFDYAKLSDKMTKPARDELVEQRAFFVILRATLLRMQEMERSPISPEDVIRVVFRYFGTVLLFAVPIAPLCGLVLACLVTASGAGGMLSGLAGMICFFIGAGLGLIVSCIAAYIRLDAVFTREGDQVATKCLEVLFIIEAIIAWVCIVVIVFVVSYRDDMTHWYRSRFDPAYQLGEAIYADDLAKVDILLDRSISVEELPWDAINATDDIAVFRLLLEHWYPIDHPSEYHDSALLSAIERCDIAMVTFLLERGVDPTAPWNRNAFVHAMQRIDDDEDCLSLFNVFFKQGIVPETVFAGDMSSPLVYCAGDRDSEKLIFALLDHGADIDSTDGGGETALLSAVKWEHVHAFLALLSRNANPDIADDYGLTPLLQAVILRNRDIVGALLKAGANPSIAMKDGETPLRYANTRDEKDDWIIHKLKQYGAKE